jgi:hypothetical protein
MNEDNEDEILFKNLKTHAPSMLYAAGIALDGIREMVENNHDGVVHDDPTAGPKYDNALKAIDALCQALYELIEHLSANKN